MEPKLVHRVLVLSGLLTVVSMLTVRPVVAGVVVDFSAKASVRATNGIVTSWGDQSGNGLDAVALQGGPVLTTVVINGRTRPVLRFDGSNYMVAPARVPARGTLFLVFSNAAPVGDRRVIGWEDSAGGAHGLGIIPSYGNPSDPGSLLVVARNAYAGGDVFAGSVAGSMEVITVSWGSEGVTVERRLANGQVLTFSNPTITSVSDGGYLLHIGAPGDYPYTYGPMPFLGDMAALRVYDQQLPSSERTAIADSLQDEWTRSFAGAPGEANCGGDSLSALALQYGGIEPASAALGFSSVQALQQVVAEYCARAAHQPLAWTTYRGQWDSVDGLLSNRPWYEESWIWAGVPPLVERGALSARLKVQLVSPWDSWIGRHGGIMFYASVPTERGDPDMTGYTIDWIDRLEDRGIRLVRWDHGYPTILVGGTPGVADPPLLWELQVRGDVIRFLGDGHLIFEVSDGSYRLGHFGVWAWGNGTRVLVDDVQIGSRFRDFF